MRSETPAHTQYGRPRSVLRFQRRLISARRTLLVGGLAWCGMALIFSISLNPVLGFIVTLGAWIGVAAALGFVALAALSAIVEITAGLPERAAAAGDSDWPGEGADLYQRTLIRPAAPPSVPPQGAARNERF